MDLEKYTDNAKETMVEAMENAKALEHQTITTAHVVKSILLNNKQRFRKLIGLAGGDYFSVLERIESNSSPNLFLFLGANIGNYVPKAADDLLQMIRSRMHGQDKLMIGFDLQKNPLTIASAYQDDQGNI